MTTYTHLLYDASDGVARITINRPEVLNAFDSTTLAELEKAIQDAGYDPQVGVIVLTGAGDRAFCAGGDVNWEANGALEHRRAEGEVKRVYTAMRDCLKPLIARVNGYAVGGGNHLAYLCDFTIASENSIFGQNGARVASPAQGWTVSYLSRIVGHKRAREMWMLCRKYSAQRMLEWGLVNAVVPIAELDSEVEEWCQELLKMSPTVIKLLKRSFEEEYKPLREQHDSDDYLEEINPGFFASGEQTEGARAFLEKRTPDFSSWR